MRDLDDDLADDQQIAVDEVVERVRDQALRRFLDGDDAVVGAAADLAEDFAQRRRRHEARRQAEARLARQVAEGRLGSGVRDDQRALERQTGRHDLAEHRPHRFARECAVGGGGQPLEHGALAPRYVKGLAAAALDLADLFDDFGAPIEQRQELIVQAINLGAQLGQAVCRRRLSWTWRRRHEGPS
jgi:hypothetical protein